MEPLSFVFADRATVPGFLGIDVQAEVIAHVLDVKADRILLVTDTLVDALHGGYFEPLASAAAGTDVGELPAVDKFVLPQGDEGKSWQHLTQLMHWAFEAGATKRSLVLAFGGGAVMNVAGLFASMLFRGTKLIYVPTTFLAMHDVTTSLKTSICHDGRKNNLGTFYAPLRILIDVAFCRTLPRSELFSGIGELAKNAALLGGKHAEGFCDALRRSPAPEAAPDTSGEEFVMDEPTLMKLLSLGIEAKMSVLLQDAYERNCGMIFEYGHTVSHAIEKAFGDGVVPHGLGVVYGMLSSSFAAERLGLMEPKERSKHDELCMLLLQRWSLPEPKPTVERVMELALRDSKRGIAGEGPDEIADVLLHGMGNIVQSSTSMLSKFPARLLGEWLRAQGFPRAPRPVPRPLPREAEEIDWATLVESAACCSNACALGLEALSAGFANHVWSLTRCGRRFVVKTYTDLVFLRLEAAAVGAADVHAGKCGLGPRVVHASPRGLVMEFIEGRELTEEDMRSGDRCLLEAVARTLGEFHGLPVPASCEGAPMLWRTVDKMLEVIARRPDLYPSGMPNFELVAAEVRVARAALERQRPDVVFGHGDMKPSNVMLDQGHTTLIDFELAGPNYRGFDLMKIFRTAKGPSEECMRTFLWAYLEAIGQPVTEANVSRMVREMCMFEPLTWLEALIFFLAMPQFKPDEAERWAFLARDRWARYSETRHKLVA